MHMSSSHRSAFAKYRCGIAPIRLETGRYAGLQESQRLCPFGCGVVESELHVLLKCTMYLHEILCYKKLDLSFVALLC